MGAIIEGVQRSVTLVDASDPDDHAQFSILRSEWQQEPRHSASERSTLGDVGLRKAQASDLAALYDLERSAFGVGYDPGHLRQFLDLFEGLILLAEEDHGGAVGYLLQAPTFPDPSTAWILSMGVRRDVQGRGIGKALLRAGLDLLRNLGVRTVLLSVDPNNLRSIQMYEGAGFRRHGYVSNYFGPHEDRLTMVLTLDTA
jgi:ribosomal protein S18 acetylase RimI-like enzyme